MLKSFGTLQLQTMNGKFQPPNNDYTEENKILLFWVWRRGASLNQVLPLKLILSILNYLNYINYFTDKTLLNASMTSSVYTLSIVALPLFTCALGLI